MKKILTILFLALFSVGVFAGISTDGTVTANAFVGDGSLLTDTPGVLPHLSILATADQTISDVDTWTTININAIDHDDTGSSGITINLTTEAITVPTGSYLIQYTNKWANGDATKQTIGFKVGENDASNIVCSNTFRNVDGVAGVAVGTATHIFHYHATTEKTFYPFVSVTDTDLFLDTDTGLVQDQNIYSTCISVTRIGVD
jgi:hypothetical protein